MLSRMNPSRSCRHLHAHTLAGATETERAREREGRRRGDENARKGKRKRKMCTNITIRICNRTKVEPLPATTCLYVSCCVLAAAARSAPRLKLMHGCVNASIPIHSKFRFTFDTLPLLVCRFYSLVAFFPLRFSFSFRNNVYAFIIFPLLLCARFRHLVWFRCSDCTLTDALFLFFLLSDCRFVRGNRGNVLNY